MTLLNYAWRLVAAVAVTVTGSAQLAADVYHPFAEPLEFDPDYQFFAPVDMDELMELSPRKRANTGWFGAYDRQYLWLSRPNVEPSNAAGDFGWGNRLDVGFMRDTGSGMQATFRSYGGPNAYFIIQQERLNRINTDDPVVIPREANNPLTGTRDYLLGDSLNVGSLTSFELNKTWRREPYRFGGVIEPMLGFRYSTFSDFALNQQYAFGTAANPLDPLTLVPIESIFSDEVTTKNTMVGGQLGFRYFTQLNRWNLSTEFLSFLASNFQYQQTYNKEEVTFYDAGLAAVVGISNADGIANSSYTTRTNNELVYGFEVRAEAAYQLTRYIRVRGGIEVIDFASGIWRGATFLSGNNQNDTTQDVQLAGYTFGIELNR